MTLPSASNAAALSRAGRNRVSPVYKVKTQMSNILRSALHTLVLAASWGLAGLAMAAPQSGGAAFVSEGRTYHGQYAVRNQAISVTIDGLVYRGNYMANSHKNAAAPGDAPVGRWGRAFLFATSAKVLQCQLDSGFPRVSGRCQSADGRHFDLQPAVPGKAPGAGSAKVVAPSA